MSAAVAAWRPTSTLSGHTPDFVHSGVGLKGNAAYLVNGDMSTCDLVLVFESTAFPVHRSIMETSSDFIRTWARFPGSVSATDQDRSDVPIVIDPVLVPFGNQYHSVTAADFANYLCMAYGVWRPQAQPLLALKIVPIATFMQSRLVLELCDLDAASTPIPWSARFCHATFDFAGRWSLPHLAVAVCAWIHTHVPGDVVLARLMSSTADHLLAMLPELNLDPVVQARALVRYVARRPLGCDLAGDLHVQGDMVDVLCRGYRALFGAWTRTSTTLEVLRLTRAMKFPGTDAETRVQQCLLEILKKQLEAGPLLYRDECHLQW